MSRQNCTLWLKQKSKNGNSEYAERVLSRGPGTYFRTPAVASPRHRDTVSANDDDGGRQRAVALLS